MFDHQFAKHGQRLADLLSFARRHVPYYQETIPPDVERLVSDSQQWQQVPLLSKRQVQANWTSFLTDPNAVDSPDVRVRLTSGSTGTPLKVARPRSELRTQTKRLWAARARWHPDIMHWKLLNLYRTVESSNQRILCLDPGEDDEYFDLSFRAMASYIDVINDYGPDWMYGPPSGAYRLAQYCRQASQDIPTLKLIETTGEQLHPHQRDLIESVFDCPVVNQYGCQEFWILSYECPARSMHAWTDDLLMEVLHDGQLVSPGDIGELVVTSLTNRVMPLIRYKMGDLVQMARSNCSCGDSRPILTPMEGRIATLIVTRETTMTSGRFERVFGHFCTRHERALLEYQVVQLDYNRMEIYLVPGENFKKDAVVNELTSSVHRLLPGMHCEFIICSEVASTPSGKTQTFISRVQAPYLDLGEH